MLPDARPRPPMTVVGPTSPWHPRRLARTGGFVVGALGVAGAAFLAVLHFQPAVAPAIPASAVQAPAALEPDPPMHGGMGPVERPTINNLVDGRLVSDFTAADFSPRADAKDGTVDVVKPRARFYLKDGQCLVVTGDSGEVAFGNAGGTDRAGMMSAGTKMPDTGKLRRVHIDLFPSVASTRPTLTMDTDNVRFDNDTLRLYTEKIPATAAEPEVPADRVPVVVRGADYDMDGTGLTLRLSAGATSRDRQLHLLEVSHGIRLTINHPATLGKHGDAPRATTASTRPSPTAPPQDVRAPAKEPAAKPPGHDLHPPVAVARGAQAYRAVFNDNVRIVSGDPSTAGRADRTLAAGDLMTLDFLQKRGADPTATAGPAIAQVSAAVPAVSAPTALPLPTAQPVVASTRPAKLGDEPITIYWTGKLRVTPIDTGATVMPLEPGQAVVRLAGRPAVLTVNGATAAAAVATYRYPDHAVRLEPSPTCPAVKLAQAAKGLVLDARAVDYDPATSVATIAGPATLHVTEAGRRTTMTATWADHGLLHVVDVGNDPGGVDHVDLMGDVHADDPKFSLGSRRLLLDLDLDCPAHQPGGRAEPRLRQLTAVGSVVCRLLRPGLPDEGIEGDRLVVGMARGADGTMAPRDVLADGRQVRAFTADQALFADHLEAVLASRGPSSKPAATGPADGQMAAVSLGSMYAAGHVRAALKNGATASADVLLQTTAADGRQFIELSGTGGAHVADAKGDVLVGSVLHVTDQFVVVVDGPGTLHTVGKPTTRPAAGASGGGRPIDVSWTDGLTYDAPANTADVVGRVLVKSTDANGTANTVVGDKAHIDFEDAPKPMGAPPKSTAARPKGGDENFGNKQLKALMLAGHMVAESELDAAGQVVRFGRLKGDRLVYTAADGIARVPGPGTLFVEKHRPPTTGPAAGGDGKAGTMAIGWQGGLAYDQATDLIRIVGDVRVGFVQDGAKGADGGPMQMRSDDLLIVMAKAVGGDAGKQPVARLVATGGVHLAMRSLDVHCHAVDLSPVTGLLVATGSDAEPGRAVGSGAGSASGGFGRLVFDTNANVVRHVDDVSGAYRR